MTIDADPKPDPDPGDDAVVAVLRDTEWTLPVPPRLVDDAVREVSRRRRRRVLAVALTSAAAVVLVVGGVSLLAGWPTGGPSTPSPAAEASQTPSSSVGGRRVKVGSYSFRVPEGWVIDPLVSHAAARFGKDGLQNDGQAPGPTDMALDLTARRFSTPDRHSQVYVTVVTPFPTAAHPGPSPAADPTDHRAAVSTILRYGVGPDGASTKSEVSGLFLGPATRYVMGGTGDGSGTTTVLIAPRSTDVVIEVESVKTSEEVLRELLESGVEG